MGYHIILKLKAVIKSNYKDFIDCEFHNDEIFKLNNPEYLELWDIWDSLFRDTGFYEYNLDDDFNFKLRMEIKPYNHSGYLPDDYIAFVKKIIIPISTQITECIISHDDYNIGPTYYTDAELREFRFIQAIQKPSVQIGCRLKSEVKPTILSQIPIPPYIYNSDMDTWPKELRNWWNISYSDISNIIDNLRLYYPQDEELLAIADWFEKYNLPDVNFKYLH
jgi:hypothetical protein